MTFTTCLKAAPLLFVVVFAGCGGKDKIPTQDCQFTVTPLQLTPCMPAAQVTTAVTTDAGCGWTASPGVPWMSLVGAASGTGPATITLALTGNYDAPRSGTLTVRQSPSSTSLDVKVSQAGCIYSAVPNTYTFPASGGTAAFQLLQQSDPLTCGGPLQDACFWTAQAGASWIVLSNTSQRHGDEPVSFTVLPNSTGAARSGTITVRSAVVQITQAG